MYSSPQHSSALREEINITDKHIRAEMDALLAAGYCHDGNTSHWYAPDSDEALTRDQAYRQLLEWD